MESCAKCGAALSLGASDCAVCGTLVKEEPLPEQPDPGGTVYRFFRALFLWVVTPLFLLVGLAASFLGGGRELGSVVLLLAGVWGLWHMVRAGINASRAKSDDGT